MALFENFPYTNTHELNLDWIIKIAKDFLEQYTHLQQLIEEGETSLVNLKETGLTELQEKADTLEAALQAWYDTHSEDIAHELAAALADLNAWYNTHQNDIQTELNNAISSFIQRANAEGQAVIESIPADYTELNDKVVRLQNVTYNREAIVDLKNPVLWALGTITAQGNITSDHGSDNIYTIDQISFPVRYQVAVNQYVYIAKYLNGVFVARTQVSGGVIQLDNTFDSYRIMVIYLNTATGTRTVEECVNDFVYMYSESLYDLKRFIDVLAELNAEIELLYTSPVIDLKKASLWEQGTITAQGNITTDHGSDNMYTKNILTIPIYYQVASDQYVYIAKYLNGVFVARSAVFGGVIQPDNTFDSYRIMVIYMNTATGTRTVEECVNDFVYMETYTQRKINTALPADDFNFFLKYAYGYTGNKICHYSVDDCYRIINNLINNSNTYNSIFDEPSLSELKSIHQDTGLCITLNLFNAITTLPSYSIENVPQRASFQTEFQNNAYWLKFAFHAKNENTDYSTANTLQADYLTFLNAVFRLTGAYYNLDTFTRLGFYGGTLEQILSIKNIEHGITGLLGADYVDRNSYYLDQEQNTILQQKGLYLDLDNKLFFIKTIKRGLSSNIISEINANVIFQKYVEVFSHEDETGWTGTCRTVATWLKNNGFKFAFPSVLFK